MRKFLFAFASTVTVGLAGVATGHAMPISAGGNAIKDAAASADLVEQTALYVVRGRRYCFYFDGWHGPGWYRCGFAWRQGLGWGGAYGWMGWDYGPAARRFGRGGVGIRESSRSFREGTTIRDGNRATVREGVQGRSSPSTREGASVRDRSPIRSETSGRGEATGRASGDGGGAVREGGRSIGPSGGGAPGGEVGRSSGGGGAARGGAPAGDGGGGGGSGPGGGGEGGGGGRGR